MQTNQVAETILQQLGGARFVAMTGAKNLLGDVASLQFKIGKNDARVTNVRIELDAATDTYTLRTFRIRGADVRELTVDSLVFADQLRAMFEARTGLRTSL